MMGRDEHGTLVRLKECRELIQAFIERHHGRVVSWSGDAVLADFSSVVESVQCAVEIQRELKAQNESRGDKEPMDFRIGINLGDVMIDDHDIFGEGVNIASRLQSLAQPGGILISGSVHDQVKNKLALGFSFLGHQQVKNISEQVAVFVVAPDGGPTLAVAGAGTIGGRVASAVAAKAPALLPLRFGAAVLDGLVAAALAFAAAVVLQGAVGPVFAFNAPFALLASERTLSSDLPSTEIEDGGRVVRTTTRSIIQRDYFGAAQQTFRRTDVEVKGTGSEAANARRFTGESREALVDPKSQRELVRPPLWTAALAAYFLLMIFAEGWLMRGSSPGKAVLGLRVSRLRGERVGFSQAALRNLAKIASVGTVFFGVVMALWSKRRQMLHDVLAGCYVHDAK